MIYEKKNVLQWFESTGLPYWTIYAQGKTESGNPALKSSDDDNLTPPRSLEDLTHRLKWLNGKYTIIASAVSKQVSKGTFREDFTISGNDEASAQATQPAPVHISGYNETDIERRINERVTSALQDAENKTLKEKVKELEKENAELNINSPFAKLAGIAAQYAPVIIPHIMGNHNAAPVARVAGLQADFIEPEPEAINDDQARLENIIVILSSIDENYLLKLEQLAIAVKANPMLWQMVDKFI